MSLSQIKSGAALSYVALVLGSVVALVYTPFMLRMLGQAEYGLFSLVNTTIAYLTILDFGFGNAIVRYTAKYREEQDRAREEALHGMFLILYVGIGVLAFVLAMVLVFNVERLFSDSLTHAELETARVLMWLAAANLAMSFPFSVYASIITAHERFVFAKTIHILRLLINPLLMVSVLALGYRAVGMIAATTILNLVFNIINLVYCRSRLHVKMRFSEFNIPLLKEIGAYSFFVFLNLIVDRMFWSSGQLLLGILAGTVAVSVYAVATQFITLLYMNLSAAMAGLFLPRVTQMSLRESAHHELSTLFIRVGRIQFILLALVLTGFTLYGQQFITLWAGPEYIGAYWVTIIIMVPLTVPLIQNLGISILQAKNMHAFRSIVYLAIVIVNVLVSIPLIKLWGPVGSATAIALSLIAGHIVIMNIYYSGHVKLEIGKFWLEIGKMVPAVLLPCGFGFLLLQYVSADHLVGLLTNVLLYTAAYCLIMYLFGMNQYEKHLLLDPLKGMPGKLRTVIG